jgi:hypothetical protein
MTDRGAVALGIAAVAAFCSVLPDRRSGDALALGVVVALWCIGLTGGSLGAWWTSGNRRRLATVIAMILGTSAARTASECLPRTNSYRALVAAITAAAMGVGLAVLFNAIGRANPDYANKPVAWRKTGLPDLPFDATVDGEHWQLRVDTRPGAPRYTLLVDDNAVLELETWPLVWNPNGAGRAI